MNSDRFARVPMGVVVSELDDRCVRLYAWLALEVGGTGWERTVTAGAKALRWERHTAYRHARHLAKAGRIEPLSMGTGSSSRMRLTPQPGSETTTPNGRGRNAMEDEPAKTKVTTEDFIRGGSETTTTWSPDYHPLGSSRGSRSGSSRDALATEPQPRGEGSDKRVARATVASNARLTLTDSPKPRPWSDCRCGRLMLTATDYAAGMCIFCRDKLEAVS